MYRTCDEIATNLLGPPRERESTGRVHGTSVQSDKATEFRNVARLFVRSSLRPCLCLSVCLSVDSCMPVDVCVSIQNDRIYSTERLSVPRLSLQLSSSSSPLVLDRISSD